MRRHLSLIAGWLLIAGCTEPVNFPASAGHSEEILWLRLAREFQFTNSDTALVLARRAYDRSVVLDEPRIIAESSQLLGEILYEMGGISQANEQLNEALSWYSRLQDTREVAETQLLLSRIYQRTENYSEAYLYLQDAMNSYKALADEAGMARIYGEIGHVYEKRGMYDSALNYQQQAQAYYSQSGDTLGLAQIHDHMGSIYEDQAVYEKAFTHFNRAYELNKASKNYPALTVNLNNLGDVYRKQGRLQEARYYTEMALKHAERTHQDYQIKSACRDLSKLYFMLGEHEKAYTFLERSYDLTDELFSRQIAEEIARTQGLYELEQKQSRIALLEKSRYADRLLAALSVSGIVLLSVFGTYIFYQQRSNYVKSRKLLEAEGQLTRIALENAQLGERNLITELENKRLREEQLQRELELKSKSLTKSTLHMIQKNEFLQDMRKRLKSLKKSEGDQFQKGVKRLIRSIDLNFNVDDDWKEFEAVFQQVHNDFFVALKRKYPGLTPSEVRLCAMIRLNLHSSDMAAIMGISQDSLRTARYRLRKTLALEKGTNLYTYISQLG